MGQGPGLSPLPGLGGVRDEEEDLESESLTGEAREGYPRKGKVQVEFSLPRLRG